MSVKTKTPETSRNDRIAAEIAGLLTAKGDADEKSGTKIVVLSTIQFLQKLDLKKPLWGFKRSNEETVATLLKNIGDLQKTLAEAPGELLVLLAIKNLSEQIPSLSEQQEATNRLEIIVGTLGHMQARGEHLLAQQPGEHPNADFLQRLVADEAWRLMKYHNLKPASGLAESLYGRISSLLFEAVTDSKDKDLQRACKSALERAKKGELNEWKGPAAFKGASGHVGRWNGKAEF